MGNNHATPSDGNILDQGFEPYEAERLLAEADRQIAERMAIRDYLLKELSSWIDSMKVDSNTAASILGVPTSMIQRIVKRDGSTFTIEQLVRYLILVGKKIEVTIT